MNGLHGERPTAQTGSDIAAVGAARRSGRGEAASWSARLRRSARRGVHRAGAGLLLVVVVTACDPATTRPQLTPTPESRSTEMRAAAPKAIESLARALQADSVPVRRIEPRDGWLETGWYHYDTGQPARSRDAGADIVRVRAWAEPSRVRHVLLYVQAERRPRYDPSRPEGDLIETLDDEHPLAKTVASVLIAIGERPGIREAAPEETPPTRPLVRPQP